MGEITGKDLEAVSSLVEQYKRNGSLSEKQWSFVTSLEKRWCK